MEGREMFERSSRTKEKRGREEGGGLERERARGGKSKRKEKTRIKE